MSASTHTASPGESQVVGGASRINTFQPHPLGGPRLTWRHSLRPPPTAPAAPFPPRFCPWYETPHPFYTVQLSVLRTLSPSQPDLRRAAAAVSSLMTSMDGSPQLRVAVPETLASGTRASAPVLQATACLLCFVIRWRARRPQDTAFSVDSRRDARRPEVAPPRGTRRAADTKSRWTPKRHDRGRFPGGRGKHPGPGVRLAVSPRLRCLDRSTGRFACRPTDQVWHSDPKDMQACSPGTDPGDRDREGSGEFDPHTAANDILLAASGHDQQTLFFSASRLARFLQPPLAAPCLLVDRRAARPLQKPNRCSPPPFPPLPL